MRILCVDTSTGNFSLALVENSKVIKQKNIKSKKNLSSAITPNIKKILEDTNTPLSQLKGFAVGLGPGSFTGLRVGLATVKALAWALNKPIAGVSSLDVIAMNVKKDTEQICVISDARRDLFYCCLYEKKGDTLKKKSKYLLIGFNDLLETVKGPVVCIGDGVPLLKKSIAANNKSFLFEEKEILWYPKARNLAALTEKRFKTKTFNPLNKLMPMYLYPDDCQVRR